MPDVKAFSLRPLTIKEATLGDYGYSDTVSAWEREYKPPTVPMSKACWMFLSRPFSTNLKACVNRCKGAMRICGREQGKRPYKKRQEYNLFPNSIPAPVCTAPGCTGRQYAHELCKKHHKAAWREKKRLQAATEATETTQTPNV